MGPSPEMMVHGVYKDFRLFPNMGGPTVGSLWEGSFCFVSILGAPDCLETPKDYGNPAADVDPASPDKLHYQHSYSFCIQDHAGFYHQSVLWLVGPYAGCTLDSL